MKSKLLPRINARPREYRQAINPQLQMNLERSAKVYPHHLITPKGIGNGTDGIHGFGRGEVMNNGIGFLGPLAIVFITLKLGEVGVVAQWPWWAVLSPLWAPFAAGAILLLLLVVCDLLAKALRRR